jgi:D-alanyl-D-alanine carboxypeptidase
MSPPRPDEANHAKLATGCTNEDILAAGASQPRLAPPGTKWSYNNYGYDLLGRVVELTTGQDVSTAIQSAWPDPLDYTAPSFPPRATA